MDKIVICERCGCNATQLYEHSYDNDLGENIKLNICWDCDHDVINGGDITEDSFEISTRREEEDYLFDPINNPKPKWM